MEELYIQGNSIADVRPLQDMKNMKKLCLENNKIKFAVNIEVLNSFKMIEFLSIFNNPITDRIENFIQLSSSLREI